MLLCKGTGAKVLTGIGILFMLAGVAYLIASFIIDKTTHLAFILLNGCAAIVVGVLIMYYRNLCAREQQGEESKAIKGISSAGKMQETIIDFENKGFAFNEEVEGARDNKSIAVELTSPTEEAKTSNSKSALSTRPSFVIPNLSTVLNS